MELDDPGQVEAQRQTGRRAQFHALFTGHSAGTEIHAKLKPAIQMALAQIRNRDITRDKRAITGETTPLDLDELDRKSVV